MADPQIGRSRIPELLKKKGKEQKDLAIYLDVSEPYLSEVINGRKKFSVFKMKKCADYFGVHMDELNEWLYPEGYDERR
jgi:transcriptional regulator with XRE-family HTH domain